jgi:uncharacterized SAM-binding protein YcdF (DUF218 family)
LVVSRRRPVTAAARRHSSSHSRRSVTRSSRQNRRLATRLVFVAAVLLVGMIAWAVVARITAPQSNTKRQYFDAIIVLGTPADADGNPSPEMLDRINEGVHEYERGVAGHLIVTGGAAHNHFVEAEVMARVAASQGVPADRIVQEPRAQNTLQNACYSARILKDRGWRSVEVISSASHLPRASMIFAHLDFDRLQWRMHAAPDNLTSGAYSNGANVMEVIKTARYLIWARWADSCS